MGVLAVIVAAGLLGPLLAIWRRFPIPILLGEIVAGIVIGPVVLDIVHPDEPLVAVLHDAGFALLMFTVGLHLRLHDPELRRRAPRAALALAVTALIATPLGYIVSQSSHLGHAAAVAVVLATSSAAIAMPVLTDAVGGQLPSQYSGLAAWIVMADIATIVALPVVGANGSPIRVVLASLAVTAIAVGALMLLRWMRPTTIWERIAEMSREKGWGIELRVALLVLFSLAWVGPKLGTSMLVAGFAAGLAVSAFGVSSRLTVQIVGIGEGFLIPAFFVVLGSTLDPSGLFTVHGVALLAGLVVGSIVTHFIGALAAGMRPAYGFVASAQMGVPIALVTIGRTEGWLNGEEASAFVAAALVSVAVCAWGAVRLGRELPLRQSIGLPRDLRTDDARPDAA